ncbi:N-acyl amino acid synthase FeeM domain-containing protein [Propionivibrio soli]|uniref:N-acyl amino acid synthase FeeM domain-containing protein n=1 Tax=Propionivibrio soli TaxID=2976531 RepID=UPI0021E9314C|nr:hypothetical protein [Propionivibrio soli]
MHSALDLVWSPDHALSPERQPIRGDESAASMFSSLRHFWGATPRRDYDIRPARTEYQHGLANMLVRRMYAWRDYKTEIPPHRPDDPHRITLAAWRFDEVIATLTLGLDSAAGLLADALYGRELAGLRRADRLIVEVSRLAVDPDFKSRELLGQLFKVALAYAKDIFEASDAVIEINPRHSLYYQRRLGFREIGGVRQCPRVNAPAVLLHQQLEEMTIPDAV